MAYKWGAHPNYLRYVGWSSKYESQLILKNILSWESSKTHLEGWKKNLEDPRTLKSDNPLTFS